MLLKHFLDAFPNSPDDLQDLNEFLNLFTSSMGAIYLMNFRNSLYDILEHGNSLVKEAHDTDQPPEVLKKIWDSELVNIFLVLRAFKKQILCVYEIEDKAAMLLGEE